MTTLRALSVRQPWAWAIIHAGKDIENRGRHTAHRGLVLIHASSGMSLDEYAEAHNFMLNRGLPAERLPPAGDLDRGGIIGAAELVDSIDAADARSANPWWMGPRGLVLASPRAIPFAPCRGTVFPLLWKPDESTGKAAMCALGLTG